MSKGDKALLELWAGGATLDVASEKLRKTPTSLASKLVRLGVFQDRASVNAENQRRGGNAMATLERDGAYTIYVVRDPNTNAPVYVGQSQNFRKRRKSHVRRFIALFAGQIPLIEELDTVEDYSLAREAERTAIAKFSKAGHVLHNVLDREEGNT